MTYHWDFNILRQFWPLLVSGLIFTLIFTFITIVLGVIIGLAAALGRLSQSKFASFPVAAYIEIFRCTPLLLLIVWFYYALPVLTGIELSANISAGLVLSLYTGAFYAEVIRGGIVSVPRGQRDAARALGMRPWPVMRTVILPQAIRLMIPPLINQSVLQLKNTSLVSVIAVPDLLYQGETITAATYRPLEVYSVIALIYFLVLYPATWLAQVVEKKIAVST